MDMIGNVFANEGKVRLLSQLNDTELSKAGLKDSSGSHQPYKAVSPPRR